MAITEEISKDQKFWDIYTLKDEAEVSKKNNFKSALSLNKKTFDVRRPVISEHLSKKGFTCEYPENKRFALCLTHDVDEVYPPLRHTLLSSLYCLRDGDISGLARQLSWRIGGKEQSPYRTFTEIMDLEEKYRARSSFFFLATDRDIRRFRYSVDEIGSDVRGIVDRGWEVGLHGGYYSVNDPDLIGKEKKRLERLTGTRITGYRNHYLRLSIPETWEFLENHGFHYDTTLGYNDAVGFRNGLCQPFYPYNLQTHSLMGILEIPLGIMDTALFDKGKTTDQAWEVTKSMIDITESCRGVLGINWHSNSFHCPFRNTWSGFYKKILRYGREKNAWMTSGTEVSEWWQNNGY